MGFIRKRVLGRLGLAGKIADIALVSNTALRYARRKGWVSADTATKFGASESSGGSAVSIAEIAVALAAATRVMGRAKRRKG
jgi:hypothetical protein